MLICLYIDIYRLVLMTIEKKQWGIVNYSLKVTKNTKHTNEVTTLITINLTIYTNPFLYFKINRLYIPLFFDNE